MSVHRGVQVVPLLLKLLLGFVGMGWILTCVPQSRQTFLGLLGHGVQTPTMVTFKMTLSGLFLGLIVLRPKR